MVKKTSDGFVIRLSGKDVLDRLDRIDDKVDQIHSMASTTNGKVKLHTKLIWGCFGFCMAILGFVISHITMG